MTRKTPDDLDRYLPDKATREAVLNGPTEFKSQADPKLVARLEELNRMSSEPEPLRPAPPSVTAYAEAEIREADPEHKTLPRMEPKVELAVPPAPSEMPTQPSLRRIEGEPEVPGVEQRVARRGLLRVPFRTAALAVLSVFIPVLIVIVLMGRATRTGERAGAAPPMTAIEPARIAPPVPVGSAATAPSSSASSAPATSAAPAPSSTPNAAPNASSTPPAPAPMGARVKPRRRGAPNDPYDAPPATAASPTSPVAPAASPPVAPPTASPHVVPTAAPSVAPLVAATAQPTAKPSRLPKDDDIQIFHQPTPPSP